MKFMTAFIRHSLQAARRTNTEGLQPARPGGMQQTFTDPSEDVSGTAENVGFSPARQTSARQPVASAVFDADIAAAGAPAGDLNLPAKVDAQIAAPAMPAATQNTQRAEAPERNRASSAQVLTHTVRPLVEDTALAEAAEPQTGHTAHPANSKRITDPASQPQELPDSRYIAAGQRTQPAAQQAEPSIPRKPDKDLQQPLIEAVQADNRVAAHSTAVAANASSNPPVNDGRAEIHSASVSDTTAAPTLAQEQMQIPLAQPRRQQAAEAGNIPQVRIGHINVLIDDQAAPKTTGKSSSRVAPQRSNPFGLRGL